MKLRPKNILLVDDEPGVREAFRLMLSIDGHSVTEATNGIEALMLFPKFRFDLVITDFAMPGMNGSQLAVELKRLIPSQPILMITGYATLAANCQNPVDAILSKPFSFAEVQQIIAQLLFQETTANAPRLSAAEPQPNKKGNAIG